MENILLQQRKMQRSPRYENTSVHGNPVWKSLSTEPSKTSGKETDSPKPKAKTKPGKEGNHTREKIVEIRHLDINYDGGVYDVIANDSKSAPQCAKLGPRGEHREAVFDSLNIMTQANQQQMDLFRRMMYLMTLLLVIVFLTAAASLALTIMMMMSGKTSTLNEPTPAPGRLPIKRVLPYKPNRSQLRGIR